MDSVAAEIVVQVRSPVHRNTDVAPLAVDRHAQRGFLSLGHKVSFAYPSLPTCCTPLQDGVNMRAGEIQGLSNAEFAQTPRGGFVGQLAAEGGATDARNAHAQRLTGAGCSVGEQEGELDDVADSKPADLLAQHDIINACLQPNFLNV